MIKNSLNTLKSNVMIKRWTIKDIKEFEKKYKVKCTKRPDGMYDVDGSITISGMNLIDLSCIPPVHTLHGSFRCYVNKLKTLKGCPLSVSRDFLCYSNDLSTLDGAPLSIGRKFDCTHNANLRFTKNECTKFAHGSIHHDPDQLIPDDPTEFLYSLPI